MTQRPRPYALWVLSRLVMLVLLALYTGIESDINYYRESLEAGGGIAHTLIEYPVAAYGLIDGVWSALPSANAFLLGWLLLMLALDLAFFVLLVRRPQYGRAARFWALAGPALGPVMYFRFDLVPAVLVGLACLYAATRPRVAGAALSIAAMLKYWPALVLPALVRQTSRRVRLVVATLVTAAIGGCIALIAAGWHRQFSPLTWQKERGLEQEAVWATPAMVLRWFRPHEYTVAHSPYESFDITGPGVSTLITLATVTEVVAALLIAYAWWRRRHDSTPVHGMWLLLATTTGFIVSDKVFSAQYVLWLIPAVAVALLRDASPALRRWAALLLVATALTQLRYPFLEAYGSIGAIAVVEAVRNALMVALFVLALREAWRTPTRD